MSVYSRNNLYTESVSIDSLMNADTIAACYEESSIDAAARAVSEISQNWNSIIEACAIDELNYLEENSVEMVYEGANLDSFINAAKQFFMNIWNKIQEIFKKVLMQFNSWFQSDKDFIKKYEKTLTSKSNDGLGDKEIKWFHYVYYDDVNAKAAEFAGKAEEYDSSSLEDFLKSVPDITAPSDLASWKETNKKLSEADTKKKILDNYRAEFLEGKSEVEQGEFVKLLREQIQGSDSKDDVKLSAALDKAIPFLKASDKIKAHINKELAADKKSIDNAIKCVENIKKTLKTTKEADTSEAGQLAGAKHSVATSVIGIMKSNKEILVTANGVELSCLKAASRQAKSICVAAVNYKKPKSANEGGMLQEENDSSLLSQIKLV
jgi:hypothetical protein